MMMKGLMGRCLKHETTLERVRTKAKQTEDELNQLRSWKTKMKKIFELSERVRKDLEQSTEEAKKTLEVKEKDLKDGLCQAKEVAVCEYRDSYALLSELGDFFLQGFDVALYQVKKAFPDLDVSNIKVEDQAQTFVMPVASNDTDDLFAKVDALGNGESAQAQPVTESAHQPVSEATIQSVMEAEQPKNTSAPN